MPADPIKHVIVLMLENHSFDQMLGCMKKVYPNLEGIDPNNPGANVDANGKKYTQQVTQATKVDPGPNHALSNVLAQIEKQCGGFVGDYLHSYPTSDAQLVMDYYDLGFLPVLHGLAQNFAVCDRWFSPVPGPTWPNRFFVHSGTCLGITTMPTGVSDPKVFSYDQKSVFNRLSEQNISWRIYYGGQPQSLVMSQLWTHLDRFSDMEDFFEDAQSPEAKFPQYCFIEPAYSGSGQNDQHPPTDIMKGELLIAEVYNAIRQNDVLWNNSLLVILYDEHGGFYDHVPPTATVAPDDLTSEFAFNIYGVRVPALLVSPWIDQGVIKTEFDHTSLLRYLQLKWNLGDLGKRTTGANSFGPELLKRQAPRTDTPGPFQDRLLAPSGLVISQQLNEHQKALIGFSHYLETELGDDLAAVGARSMRTLNGMDAQLSVAKERFQQFLLQGPKANNI